MKRFVLLLILLNLFTSCSEENKSTSPLSENASNETIARGSVSGKIKDSSGIAMVGVAVTLFNDSLKDGGYSSNTDSTGYFRVADVVNGTYTMTISKEGYNSYTTDVTISIDEDFVTVADIVLEKVSVFGSVKGYMLSKEDNSVVANEQVKASGQSSTSDSKGEFIISGLSAGYHKVTLGGGKYKALSIDSVLVEKNKITDIGINLLEMNVNVNEKDAYGYLIDTLGSISDVGKITVVITGDNIDGNNPKEYELSFEGKNNKFSGFVYVPVDGESWEATVKVYSLDGKKTGQKLVSFGASSGDIYFGEFSNYSATPKIVPLVNDTLFASIEAELSFKLLDYYGGSINSYKIDFDNNGIWDIVKDIDVVDSTIITEDHTYTSIGTKTYSILVTDNDGNETVLTDSIFVSSILWQTYLSAPMYSQIITVNDGYVIAGHHNNDIKVIKLDKNGKLVWDKNYGGIQVVGVKVAKASEGLYICGEITKVSNEISEYFGGDDTWLIKIDDDGTLLWEKTIGTTADENVVDLIATSDNGCVIMYNQTPADYTNYIGDYCIAKLSSTGSIEWNKTFGTVEDEKVTASIQTSDNGYLLTVIDKDSSLGSDGKMYYTENDIIFTKITSTGVISWQKTTEITKHESVQAIIENSDGTYTCFGSTLSSSRNYKSSYHAFADIWMLKLDNSGNILWETCFGGYGDDYLYSVVQDGEGNYILTGKTDSDDGDVSSLYGRLYTDAWVIKCDNNGSILWEKTYGGSESDEIMDISMDTDKSYVTVGYSLSTDYDLPADHGYAWIMKLVDIK